MNPNKMRTPIAIAIVLAAFFAVAGGLNPVCGQPAVPATTPPAGASAPVKVFILSGQSNMEGLGGSGRLSPELATQPDVKIWSAILTEPDPTAWEPLAGGFGVGKGFGPEITIGQVLKEALPGHDVYLIKSARSGTPLSKTGRVNFDPDGTKNEYTKLICRVKAAVANLEAAGRTVSVDGMFWMQGESDALDRHNQPESAEPSAERYGANLRNFITSVREELALPDLPVFLGRFPRTSFVRKGTLRFPQRAASSCGIRCFCR